MKKIFSFLLAVLMMAALLVGCGQQQADASGNDHCQQYMHDSEFLLFRKFEKEKQQHRKKYDSHKQNKYLLVLQHTECGSSVLQILQFQNSVNDHIGRLVLQMYHRQMLGKLIQYQKYGCNQGIYDQHNNSTTFLFLIHEHPLH